MVSFFERCLSFKSNKNNSPDKTRVHDAVMATAFAMGLLDDLDAVEMVVSGGGVVSDSGGGGGGVGIGK